MSWSARLATPDDHAAIARLFVELRVPRPAPTRESLATQMLPRVVLLCEAGEAIAYAWWQTYGATAHVAHVVVDPRARRRGAGRALLEEVRGRARDEGCTRWFLNVKKDNHAALGLYARAGFAYELDSWAMTMRWRVLDALPRPAHAPTAFVPTARDDAAIAARFGVDPARIALLRARPGVSLVALREEDVVAFAAFDPEFPGASPFRAARADLARPLLEAIRPRAPLDRFDYAHLSIDADGAVAEALRAAGAEVDFEAFRMSGALGAP